MITENEWRMQAMEDEIDRLKAADELHKANYDRLNQGISHLNKKIARLIQLVELGIEEEEVPDDDTIFGRMN